MRHAQPSSYAPLHLSSRLDKHERQRLAIQSHLAQQTTAQRERFDAALEAIMTNATLESVGKLLLITLAQMNRINSSKVSYARIARRTGYSDRTISRHIGLLEQQGVLKVTRSTLGGSNRYAIMIPEPYSA
jgi:DNA-binding transcriptional ArsR family regulator